MTSDFLLWLQTEVSQIEVTEATARFGSAILTLTGNTPGSGVPALPEGVTRRIYLLPDELKFRLPQCKSFMLSELGRFARYVDSKACAVLEVASKTANTFLDENVIHGVGEHAEAHLGIYLANELLGIVSLGRRNSQIASTRVILDRLCFKGSTFIINGAAALFDAARIWALNRGFNEIVSFSDNRFGDGTLYAALGFEWERSFPPDRSMLTTGYGSRYTTLMPDTEMAAKIGGVRSPRNVYDLGKQRWVFNLRPEEHVTWNSQKSKNCAKQHERGVFKHAHIRGNFNSYKNKAAIYFGSSFELRCMYLLEQDPAVISFQRCEAFETPAGWRNPDLRINFTDGRSEIWEVKPEAMQLLPPALQQIEDSRVYAASKGVGFRVWTEKDSGLGQEASLANWARNYLAEVQGEGKHRADHKENNRRKRLTYYQNNIASDKVDVWCDYCNLTHRALRITYTKNIERNGTYICERYGGHLAGKRPKSSLKKTNPYSSEVRKQCSLCKEVQDFEAFNRRVRSWDGWNASCRKCARGY